MAEKTKRQLQAERTKQSLLQAVKGLLQDHQLDEIPIRDICKIANVSIGTFYLYFSCKEEAFLYLYRECDEDFSRLDLQDEPRENIRAILTTYYHMVHLDNLEFDRKLYKCHLSYYDAYFFDENRSVFVRLKKEIETYACIDNAEEITWGILEFCRGRIYNLCIGFREADDSWYDRQTELTLKYLDMLCGKPAMAN